MARRHWRIRLSASVERDFIAILEWTAEQFGRRQALIYRRTLLSAVADLSNGRCITDSQARDEIRPGVRSLHVARKGRRGRHFVLYQANENGAIDVLRILHYSMDVVRHIPH
jgi:toxin ParE1/3/4